MLHRQAFVARREARKHELRARVRSIRAQQARNTTATLGVQQASPDNLIQRSVEAVAGQVTDAVVDMEWVRSQLGRPTGGQIKLPSFAFFESPRMFLLRYGELGREPVHGYLKLEDWHWRLTDIYP